MKNFVETGKALTVTMDADVAAGDVAIIGTLIGVSAATYLSGQKGVINRDGVFALSKDASVFTEGAIVYWDDIAKVATSTATANTEVGIAVNGGALTGDATVDVLIP